MSLKSIFLKDTVIYGFTSYLGLVAAFFLTPIYTRILSKADYGTMDLFNTWNNFFLLILPLGLTTAILRLHVEFSGDPDSRRKYLGTLFWTILGNYLIYALILLMSVSVLRDYYYKDGFLYSLFYLSLAIIPMQIMVSYFQAINRIEFRKYTYLSINLTGFIFLTGLGFSLVYVFELGILGFFLAALVGSIASLLIALVTGYRNIYFSFDTVILRQALSYSVFLILTLIFLKLTYLVDRIIITSYLTIQDVGEYSIGVRLGSIMGIVVGGFTTAWFPYAMSLINTQTRSEVYQRAFKYYLFLFGFAALVLILFTKELLLLIAPAYLSIEPVAYLLIATAFLTGVAYFFNLGIHISKKTQYLTIPAAASFLANVGLSLLLVHYLGLGGIALGTLLAVFIWLITQYFLSYRLEGITFDVYRVVLAMLIIAASSYFVFSFNSLQIGLYVTIGLKCLVLLVTVLALVTLERDDSTNLVADIRRRNS